MGGSCERVATSMFVTNLYQRMPSIRLWFVIWKASSFAIYPRSPRAKPFCRDKRLQSSFVTLFVRYRAPGFGVCASQRQSPRYCRERQSGGRRKRWTSSPPTSESRFQLQRQTAECGVCSGRQHRTWSKSVILIAKIIIVRDGFLS